MQKLKVEVTDVKEDNYRVFCATILVNGVEVCKEYAENEQLLYTQISESTELYIMLYKGMIDDEHGI